MAPEKTDPKAVVIDWIDHILEQKRWNGTDLARHSDLAPSTILRLLNNKNHRFVPSLKTLQKIASGSGYPIPRKVTDALGAPRIEADPEGEARERRPGRSVRDTLDSMTPPARSGIKVRTVSSLPASLMPIAREQEVVIDRPHSLEGDETAFAFYMPDNLEPCFKAGTKMFATRRRDPAEGDIVLVTTKSGQSRVRYLVDMDETGLTLTKGQSSKADEKLAFDDLSEIAIVAVIELF